MTTLVLVTACTGCATGLDGPSWTGPTWSSLEARMTSPDALQYWLRAVEADAGEREELWKDARKRKLQWQIGLLQSLPGSRRYNAGAARKRLSAVLERAPPADVAAVARLRLQQLAEEEQLRAQVDVLQRRLDKIVAIERRMER